MIRRNFLFLAFVAVLSVAVAIFLLSFQYFRSEEEAKAFGRLSLYRSTVVAELERFSHLTYVLARDPFVIETAAGGSTSDLDTRLAEFAERSGLDAIYLMRPDGLTISASNAGQTQSFVGQNYSFRPYFKDAVSAEQGRFYGIGATTGLPGYFIADAVVAGDGTLLGVIAIKIDLIKLENSWREAGEQVILSNADGVVLLASDATWRYQTLAPITPDQRARIDASRQFTGQPLQMLDWNQRTGARAVLNGADRIYLSTSDLPHHWQLHYFADHAPALTRSWLLTGLFTIIASTVLILGQFRQTRRIGAALRRAEAEEAQLRVANERLAVEIEERKTAERRLKRTQDELERAGRLAALGQLSASVTHELGQPIAAMRNHLAAADINPRAVDRVLPRIEELVDRMEGITRQLKFFARTEGDQFAAVDLGAAMQASLSLVQPNMVTGEVALSWTPPAMPICVRGNKLRIEQVMVNLLRNAVDAMEDSDAARLAVEVGQDAENAWFTIRDTGHGLGDATLADLQEPFVTTRESGRGMGLGLAISANIVAEHHGRIDARNAPDGGAIFTVYFANQPAETFEDAAE